MNLLSVFIVFFSDLRLQQNNPVFNQRFSNGISIPTRFSYGNERSVAVHASSEADAVNETEPESEKSEEAVSVENLPLESKQQMILEQRLKMKLAKKLRLRRKRLVRKRRLRKKGRWPPSKMKKLKNV